VLFFQGQAAKHAGVLQFKTICSDLVMHESTLLWPDSGLQGFFDHLPNRQDFLCVMGHPNEHGHAHIAQHLIIEMDRVIITE
jgi:hypothetical protein